jgi:hypothetical protein
LKQKSSPSFRAIQTDNFKKNDRSCQLLKCAHRRASKVARPEGGSLTSHWRLAKGKIRAGSVKCEKFRWDPQKNLMTKVRPQPILT